MCFLVITKETMKEEFLALIFTKYTKNQFENHVRLKGPYANAGGQLCCCGNLIKLR